MKLWYDIAAFCSYHILMYFYNVILDQVPVVTPGDQNMLTLLLSFINVDIHGLLTSTNLVNIAIVKRCRALPFYWAIDLYIA